MNMKGFSMIFMVLLVFCSTPSFSQEEKEDDAPTSKWLVNGVFGYGLSALANMPGDIHQPRNENIQMGMLIEREVNSWFSIVSNIEYELLSYEFDGMVEPISDGQVRLEQAGDGIKYPGIHQSCLAANIQGRAYVYRNYDKEDPCDEKNGFFLQGGLRIAQSLDFTNVFLTTYHYRQHNEFETLELQNYINQTLFQAEFSIGVKGSFDGILGILSSSSIGMIYQFTPMFNEAPGVEDIRPLHFTWRFIF